MSGIEEFSQNVAPILGAVLAPLMFLGPMYEVLVCRRRERLGQEEPLRALNPVLFPFMLSNCIGWVSYGFVRTDIYIIVANLPGIYLAVFYSITGLKLSTSRAQYKLLEGLVLLMVVLWGILDVFALYVAQDAKETITGVGSVSFSLLMFASPLSMAYKVLKEKNSAYINIGFMLLQNVSCLSWTLYGFFTGDLFVLIPNGIGFVFGIIQAIMVLGLPRFDKVEAAAETPEKSEAFSDTVELVSQSTLTPSGDPSCDAPPVTQVSLGIA